MGEGKQNIGLGLVFFFCTNTYWVWKSKVKSHLHSYCFPMQNQIDTVENTVLTTMQSSARYLRLFRFGFKDGARC